jgi:hypothetical protein
MRDHVWNKGLTKETDERVAKIAVKLKGKQDGIPNLKHFKPGYTPWNAGTAKKYLHTCKYCGKIFENGREGQIYCSYSCSHHAPQHHKHIIHLFSKICKACGKEYFVKKSYFEVSKYCSLKCRPLQHSKSGYREDLQHFIRSTWEANVCRIFKLCDIRYEYESNKCRFDLGVLGTLTIDLYLPDSGKYVEVKGYLHPKCKDKWKKFIELYPNEVSNIFMIDYECYQLLTILFKDKIELWE